jgi:hypothetical protein
MTDIGIDMGFARQMDKLENYVKRNERYKIFGWYGNTCKYVEPIKFREFAKRERCIHCCKKYSPVCSDNNYTFNVENKFLSDKFDYAREQDMKNYHQHVYCAVCYSRITNASKPKLVFQREITEEELNYAIYKIEMDEITKRRKEEKMKKIEADWRKKMEEKQKIETEKRKMEEERKMREMKEIEERRRFVEELLMKQEEEYFKRVAEERKEREEFLRKEKEENERLKALERKRIDDLRDKVEEEKTIRLTKAIDLGLLVWQPINPYEETKILEDGKKICKWMPYSKTDNQRTNIDMCIKCSTKFDKPSKEYYCPYCFIELYQTCEITPSREEKEHVKEKYNFIENVPLLSNETSSCVSCGVKLNGNKHSDSKPFKYFGERQICYACVKKRYNYE